MAALLSGCSTVSSKSPLGDPTSADDAKKLAGIWMTLDGDPIYVQYIDGNELRVANVGWNKAESRFELEEARAFLTQDEDRQYLNLAESSSAESASVEADAAAKSINYSFVRLNEMSDRSIVMMFTNVDAFEKAVKDKVLGGTIEQSQSGTSIKLDVTTEQLNKFVDPAKVGEQFDPETAFPLMRIQQAPAEE